MSKEFDIYYGEEEFKTVDGGIEDIQAVLMGEDIHAKERLLFFLDWYMDPYYNKDLSVIKEPLKELLQKIVITDNDTDIIEEALHLLESYTDGPYAILETNKDNISKEFQHKIFYLLSDNI